MRILVAHDRLHAGDGSSRYFQGVVQRLCEQGHEVGLACNDVQLPLDPRASRVHAGTPSWDVLFGSDLRVLRMWRPYARGFVYAPLGSLPWLEDPASEAALRPLESEALRDCDALLRFTERGMRLLEETYGYGLAAKGHVAPWFHRAPAGPAQVRFDREPARLLWVGRLTPTKDVAFLLDALARIRSQPWVLEVIGEGPERDRLAAQADRAGLSERVRFRGRVPDSDLAHAYREAALFLTASRVEHYSLTLMEAYAVGTPCIGRRPDLRSVYNACDEQIEEGVTGHLVSTPQAMANAVRGLLDDEPRRKAYGEAGWQRLRTAWNRDAFGEVLSNALNACAAWNGESPSPA